MNPETDGQKTIKSRLWSAFYPLRQLGREQWLVSLALAPLSLVLFGQVSLVGLLANLVAIPWVTFVVTPLAMVGALMPLAWDMAALGMQALHALLGLAALLPGAVWQTAQAPLALGLLACAGGA